MAAGKGTGAMLQTPVSEKLGLPGAYHGAGFVQSGFIWQQWEREARRLFIEFWRTADDRHLRAFAAHVRAMRIRARRGKR
jgi:hypothetical protein